MHLTRDGNLDLDTGFEGNASLIEEIEWDTYLYRYWESTHDLLDNLAGGVEVDQTLVDLQLEAIPGLGTLTTRLKIFPRK